MKKRARRWFQIHLPTVCVSTMCMALLLGVNLTERVTYHQNSNEYLEPSEYGDGMRYGYSGPYSTYGRGWPVVFEKDLVHSSGISKFRLVANIIVNIAIIAAIAFSCEWWICRKSRTRDDMLEDEIRSRPAIEP